MNLSMILATGPNGEIGKDGKLPWSHREDLLHFKSITTGHVVVMGRKTAESIGKPLPNRCNIIVSESMSRLKASPAGFLLAADFDDGLRLAKRISCDDSAMRAGEDIFFIGGASIYEFAAPLVDTVYLTEVSTAPDCDTFFRLDRSGFVEVERRKGETPGLTFVRLERKR